MGKSHMLLTSLTFVSLFSIGQSVGSESLARSIVLSDTIKNEIDLFSIKNPLRMDNASTVGYLKEIPLKYCTNNCLVFKRGNFFGNDVQVELYGYDDEEENRIRSIHVYSGRYSELPLPVDEFSDIVDSRFCSAYTEKNKPILSHCRVLRSIDRRRLYITMIAGSEAKPVEVIWILQDQKYLGRMVNK